MDGKSEKCWHSEIWADNCSKQIVCTSILCISLFVVIHSLPIFHVLFPGSFIPVSISIRIFSFSTPFSCTPLSFVYGPVWVDKRTISVLYSTRVLSFVSMIKKQCLGGSAEMVYLCLGSAKYIGILLKSIKLLSI